MHAVGERHGIDAARHHPHVGIEGLGADLLRKLVRSAFGLHQLVPKTTEPLAQRRAGVKPVVIIFLLIAACCHVVKDKKIYCYKFRVGKVTKKFLSAAR